MSSIMKKYFLPVLIVSLFLLLAGIDLAAQKNIQLKNAGKGTDSIAVRIKQIRGIFNRINSDTIKFKVVQTDIEGESSEGGLVRKFYSHDTLQKMITIFYGEMGKIISEYFFNKDVLVFLYQKEEQYNKPMYLSESKTISIKENRYYFNNEKLIRWIADKGTIVNTNNYSAKEMELLQDVKRYR